MINLLIILLIIIFLLVINFNFKTNTQNIFFIKGLIDNSQSDMLISLKYGFIFNYNNNCSYLLPNSNVDHNNLLAFDINSNTMKKIVSLNNNLTIKNISYNNKKLIIFIRHARSISNDTKNYLIRNPDLCQKGYEQSKILASKIIDFNNYLKSKTNYIKGIELAIISPLKRTLLTAIPTLEKLSDINVETSFLCTETALSPSNTGFSSVEEFKQFNNSIINKNIKVNEKEYNKWSELIWNSYMNDIVLIHKRKKLFDEYLKSKNEKVIIIFSHGDFLKKYFNHILNDDNRDTDYKLYLENTNFITMYHD